MAERNQEQDEAVEQRAETAPEVAATETSGESIEAQLQAARDEAAQYKDRFLRERAEMENFRKRQERIANDRTARYKRELLEKVLDVVDNLDRAMRYQESLDRDGLQQSLRMVQWQLNELLKGEGLSPVPTVGAAFDPHIHEAIETVASSDHPEGHVVEEVRKGYMLGSEMLRPARVKVSEG